MLATRELPGQDSNLDKENQKPRPYQGDGGFMEEKSLSIQDLRRRPKTIARAVWCCFGPF